MKAASIRNGNIFILFVLVWVGYALFLTSQKVAVGLEQGLDVSFSRAWVRPAVAAFWWAMLTPLILRLARAGTQAAFSWPRIALVLLFHLATGVLVTYLHNQITTFSLYLAHDGGPAFNPFSRRWFAHFLRNPLPMTYLLMIGLSLVFQFRIKLQKEETARARLASSHARLRLAHLRQSLQPHLLFNTLHTIQIQVQESNPQGASELVSRLSHYLRLVLDQRDQDLASLQRELSNLDAYLAIQAIRFGPRFNLIREVAAGLGDSLVPAFCLQTLVENAVKHGDTRAPMTLRIFTARDDLVLCLTNQIAAYAKETPGWGLGLTLLRAQLDIHFPVRNALTLQAGEQGVTTRVQFPCRPGQAP